MIVQFTPCNETAVLGMRCYGNILTFADVDDPD